MTAHSLGTMILLCMSLYSHICKFCSAANASVHNEDFILKIIFLTNGFNTACITISMFVKELGKDRGEIYEGPLFSAMSFYPH